MQKYSSFFREVEKDDKGLIWATQSFRGNSARCFGGVERGM